MKRLTWPQSFVNQIICGDCLEVMKEMPEKCVDLVITSPPYNLGKGVRSENKYVYFSDNLSMENYHQWTVAILNELLRICRFNIFYIIQLVSNNKIALMEMLNDYKRKIKDIMIWKKSTVEPAIQPGVLNSGFEFIIIFSNDHPEKRKFSNVDWWGKLNNIIVGETASSNKYAEIHKATFPQYIPGIIIKYFSRENDIVFDPMVGTGTTARVAKNLKRRFIGIDIVPQYCKEAKERLAQGVL